MSDRDKALEKLKSKYENRLKHINPEIDTLSAEYSRSIYNEIVYDLENEIRREQFLTQEVSKDTNVEEALRWFENLISDGKIYKREKNTELRLIDFGKFADTIRNYINNVPNQSAKDILEELQGEIDIAFTGLQDGPIKDSLYTSICKKIERLK